MKYRSCLSSCGGKLSLFLMLFICTSSCHSLYKKRMDLNTANIGFSVTEGISLPDEWSRGGHIGGILDGKVVVAGGSNWSKDKTTKYWLNSSAVFHDGRWIEGPGLPKPLAYPMYGYDQSGIYVAGGTSDGKSVSGDVYVLSDLEPGSVWRSLPQLPEATGYGAGVVYEGKFYITCGSLGNEKTNKMWVLEINQPGRGWVECSPLPGVARMFPAFSACGKYLYLCGGLEEISPLKPLNDIYRYDPEKDEWTQLKELPLRGYAWSSQPVDDHRLLLTGRADGNVHDGIWTVNTDDSSMEKVGNLCIPSTTAPLIRVNKNLMWMVGGEPDANRNRTGKVSVIHLEVK